MYVLAIDPGYATGFAFGEYFDDSPLQLLGASVATYEQLVSNPTFHGMLDMKDLIVVAERFDLNVGNQFKADLTGVRVEGILDLLTNDNVSYRPRTSKAQVKDDVVKRLGWWQTGKDVDWEDGRDANDAIIHLIGHVAFDLEHRPTLEMLRALND